MLLHIREVLVFLAEITCIDWGVVVDVGWLRCAYGAAERLDISRVLPVAAWCGRRFM